MPRHGSSTAPNRPAIVRNAPAATYLQRFPTSTRGHLIFDQYGAPLTLVGDSAWSMIGQLKDAEIDYYSQNRASKGINFYIVNLLEHLYSDHAPNNIDNVAPFTGTALQSAVNSTYMARMTHALTVAQPLGITILVEPLYGGFDTDDTQGWRTETEAAYTASTTNIVNYGTSLASLFGSFPNLMWHWGHDRTWNSYPTFKAAKKLLFDTIRANAPNQLHVFGGGVRNTVGSTVWSGTNAITADVDNVYIDNTGPGAALTSGYSGNTKPIGVIEAWYEQEHSLGFGAFDLRNPMWGPLCAGAAYVLFGNNPIWYFGSTAGAGFGTPSGTWQANLDQAGSNHLGICARFMAALGQARFGMIPDTGGTFLTAGAGSGATQAFALYSSTNGLVYKPHTSSITISLSVFEAPIRIRWFDPTAETYTTVSASVANSGTQVVTHPGTNSHGDNDWLLVVDLVTARNASPPTIETPTAAVTRSVSW